MLNNTGMNFLILARNYRTMLFEIDNGHITHGITHLRADSWERTVRVELDPAQG